MGFLFGKKSTISNEEARLNSLRIQTATYGACIPIVFGTNRVTGNIIDYVDFTAIPHTETQESGKGGRSSTSNTTYTYTVAASIAICEGIIQKIGTVWQEKNKLTLGEMGLELLQNRLWPYMITNYPERMLSYKNVAYVSSVFDLGGSDSMPQLSFEVFGLSIYDSKNAEPSEIIKQLLTNKQYGLNFPLLCIDNLNNFRKYCLSANLLFSPVLSSQTEGYTWLESFIESCNSEFVWSEGKLKIIPYGEENISNNGESYTANITPLYHLTDDDFLSNGDELPITISRVSADDAYNVVKIEFINSANDYNIDIVQQSDLADIVMNGEKPADVKQMHWITNQSMATVVSGMMLWRQLYRRNFYRFRLSSKYCRLEPMDIVTITDMDMGIIQKNVRIKEIEEDEAYNLTIEAEDCLMFCTTPYSYQTQPPAGIILNNAQTPGSVNPPSIFTAPTELTNNSLEVWIAVSGTNEYWAGCDVWVSTDNASYAKIGTISAPARHGTLKQALPTGLATDTVNALNVNVYRGQILACSNDDAINLRSLLYVDGEFMAYKNAELVADKEYKLTYLVRGAYGSEIKEHDLGTNWARLDNNVFKYKYGVDQMGKTVYIKFTSYNYNNSIQETLDQVNPYTYVLQTPSLQKMFSSWDSGVKNNILYTVDKNVEINLPTKVGEYTSQIFNLSSIGIAASSTCSYKVGGAGQTAIETNLSLDGGATWIGWKTCENNTPIKGIEGRTGVSSACFQYRIKLSTIVATKSPQLSELEFKIYSYIVTNSLSISLPAVGTDISKIPVELVGIYLNGINTYVTLPRQLLAGKSIYTIELTFSTTQKVSSSADWSAPCICGFLNYGGNVVAVTNNNGYIAVGNDREMLADGNIHHIAIVSDGITGKGYNEKIPYNATPFNPKPLDNVSINFGVGLPQCKAYAECIIYEARFWDIARLPEELDEPITGREPGLRAWYRCLESSGNVLKDSSSNGLNGTIIGNIWG